MAIALGTLLALVSIVVIAYPFLGSKRYWLVSERFVHREKLRAERLRIYRKISDLETDYSSGDLTEADFQAQRDQLRITAAELLREESETTVPVKDRDEQLEREISRLREQYARSSEGGDRL